jgi:hypothetical protein
MTYEEKIEAAAKAIYEIDTGSLWDENGPGSRQAYRNLARSAFPILAQIDEPTVEEDAIAYRMNGMVAVREFVRTRNSSRQPKPVDPRREQVKQVISQYGRSSGSAEVEDKLADAILAALDKEAK